MRSGIPSLKCHMKSPGDFMFSNASTLVALTSLMIKKGDDRPELQTIVQQLLDLFCSSYLPGIL